MKRILLTAALATLIAAPAFAQDKMKLAIGQRGNWDTAIPHLGVKAGIFKKHNLDLELTYTSGSGETLQPVISNSVDVGLAVGTMGAISAYAKGAPVRIIGAEATGAADYWYAKGGFRHQDDQGHQRKNHRLLDQGLLDQFHRAGLHQATRPDRDAAGDRQSALDADRGDDRSGRCRLGRAAFRPEGNGRRQDSRCRTRDRFTDRARVRPSAPSSPTPTRSPSARTCSFASCRPIARPSPTCTAPIRR